MATQDSDLERPAVLGAPFIAHHPMWRRMLYVAIGIFLSLAAATENALLSANISSVAGEAGLTSAEASWLVIAFVSGSSFANLVVIKGRQQFGLHLMQRLMLGLDIASGLVCVVWPAYPALLVNRALNGLMVSTCVASGIYYFIQALPKSYRLSAIVLGICSVQMATPLAAMVPVDTLTALGNAGFIRLATAMSALCLLLVVAFPLPPTYTARVINPLDGLSAGLLYATILPLTAVLALGRTLWWTDTPWLGALLVMATLFGAAAIAMELCRTTPLLQVEWLSSWVVIQFVAVAVMERIVLGEQSTGVSGLFSQAGLINDQLHTFYGFVLAGMVCGAIAVAFLITPKTIPVLCIAALFLIGVAAWIDTGSNELSRPREFWFSQMLLGLGTTMFVAPALVYGISLVLKSDPSHFISTILVFSAAQSLGSVIGSAVLGSLQYYYQQYTLLSLSQQLPATADTAARLHALGRSALSSMLQTQSNTLGYLNVFGFVRDLAIAVALFMLGRILWRAWRETGQEKPTR
jgi:hypothetical protein